MESLTNTRFFRVQQSRKEMCYEDFIKHVDFTDSERVLNLPLEFEDSESFDFQEAEVIEDSDELIWQ